jgi:hypothetical protein
MASYWTKDEQNHLVEAIPLYRQELMQSKAPEKVTLEIADHIYQTCPDLKERSVKAIHQRLPYLENLLAGVFEKNDYAKKDQYLYSRLPRDYGSKKPNLSNTRHKYNGALSEYLKKGKDFDVAN